MFNFILYKRELKGSIKTLVIFCGVLSLYIVTTIEMFDPDTLEMLERFTQSMPEFMSAMGMSNAPVNYIGFLSSYLYGMLLLVFPMVFIILRANGLIARYVDRGSMVTLLAAPVKRSTIAFTQMKVLGTGIFLLVAYCTLLELACTAALFPDEAVISELLVLNGGLLCLQLFIGGICFLASCLFDDTKYSIGVGAGVPTIMYILLMLSNVGGDAENAKYFTFFSLFNPDGLVAGETGAIAGVLVLLGGAILLFTAAIWIFSQKDLHI